MSNRKAIGMIVNVLAVLGPTAVLYARYGADAKIDTRSAEYLLPLSLAMVASFVAGTFSARVLYSSLEGFTALFQSLTKALHQKPAVQHRSVKRAV